MALRLQCTYYSFESNTPYTISVYDEEYAGAVVDFNTDEEGHIISYTGEGEGMKVPILTTKCDVNILIETQAIEDFLTDFDTAYEGQFRLKVTSGSTGIWYGHILTDLVTIEDLPIEQKPIFTLSATDGIKRLQKVPYKDTSEPYSGQESIIQHLLNCIAFIGLTDLMTDNTHVLKSVVNWVPASITSGDEMDNTYFEHRALYQIDDKGNYKYNSVYRVLENLCYAFHAQFRMGAGGYWFFQHNEYENNSVTPYAYASDKTLISSSAMLSYITVDDKFTGKFGRGYRSFFPPLNYAQVNYVHFGYVNLARGYIWLETNQPTIPESPTVYRVGDNTSFHFKANFNYTISATGAKPKYTKFNITLQVDTNYLRRDSSGGNGSIYNQPQSVESSSDTYELTVETPVIQYDPMITPIGQGNFITEFTSIPFPTGGVVSFTIDFVDCYDTFGVVINSGLDVRWKFSNVELTPIPANDVSTYSNTRSVTAYNATTGNSESEVVNTIIGQEFGFGRLRVDNGTDFEDGVDWGVGATVSDRTFEELLAIELMRSQSVPIQKMTMSFQHDTYDGLKTIKHKSNTWVFYKGRWHGAKEYWEGEWRLLNTSGTTTGNTSLDWVIDNIDGDGNPIITVVPTGSGGTPNLGNDDSGNPNNPGYTAVIDALFPRTTDDIDSGDTVTEIPVSTRTVGGEYKVGQTVTLIDPYSGAQQTFVISQESAISDTVLYVTSQTANFTFPEGSWIVTSQEEQTAISGSSGSYRQEFATHASATITVTAASLPINSAAIRVYFDNGQMISPNYWSHSGNVITLTFLPNGAQSIWVEFSS